MEIIIADNYEEMSKQAAAAVRDLIQSKNNPPSLLIISFNNFCRLILFTPGCRTYKSGIGLKLLNIPISIFLLYKE